MAASHQRGFTRIDHSAGSPPGLAAPSLRAFGARAIAKPTESRLCADVTAFGRFASGLLLVLLAGFGAGYSRFHRGFARVDHASAGSLPACCSFVCGLRRGRWPPPPRLSARDRPLRQVRFLPAAPFAVLARHCRLHCALVAADIALSSPDERLV